MRHYFLGMAANYRGGRWFSHLFTMGRKKDLTNLESFLGQKYGGEALLCKNGRSGLAFALKAFFQPGDAVIVNGFTCFAVYEAIKKAGLTPVFVDIENEDLNFSIKTLEKALPAKPKGIIVQNTLGNPVDIKAISKFAKEHDLIMIEDLAHSAGVKYPDGEEAGTVGAATVLSFGKDKSIDTVSGGAVIFRAPYDKKTIKAPSKAPRPSDHLRARLYPMFGAFCRTLTYIHLGGAMMRLFVKLHWVEKSADNRLDLTRRISKFEAKLALRQLENLKNSGESPLRIFYLVEDRAELLKKLTSRGYYFGGFWYEKPVSPERYYKRVHFDEAGCPNAVSVSEHIINIPTNYSKNELAPAFQLIKNHLKEGK